MRLILKILLAPVMLVLAFLIWLCTLTLHISAVLLNVLSVLLVLVSIFSFIDHDVKNGVIELAAACVCAFALRPADDRRLARCTASSAAGLDERKSILIEQARKCKSFRAIFLQRGLACGDHANHSHARQQGQDHCPMPDGTDGLRKESG